QHVVGQQGHRVLRVLGMFGRHEKDDAELGTLAAQHGGKSASLRAAKGLVAEHGGEITRLETGQGLARTRSAMGLVAVERQEPDDGLPKRYVALDDEYPAFHATVIGGKERTCRPSGPQEPWIRAW